MHDYVLGIPGGSLVLYWCLTLPHIQDYVGPTASASCGADVGAAGCHTPRAEPPPRAVCCSQLEALQAQAKWHTRVPESLVGQSGAMA